MGEQGDLKDSAPYSLCRLAIGLHARTWIDVHRSGSMAAVSAVPRPLRKGIRKGHPRDRVGGGIVIGLLIFGVSVIIAFISPQLLSFVFYAPPQIKAVDTPAVRSADIV